MQTRWIGRIGAAAWVVLGAGCVNEIGPAGPDGAGEAGAEQAIAPSPFFGGDDTGAVFAVDLSFWEGPIAEQEMDCYWDSGVRHVVTGTQLEEVTRQQLDMAVRRGMTVDGYVYLYWTDDMAGQVDTAFARTDGSPIGRMWLDVEEDVKDLGANAVIDKVQAALDRCRIDGAARGVQCGIYSGNGFWRGAMANTPLFADVPLWYARYNGGHDVEKRALSSWSEGESFGAWEAPVAKQWAEQALCGTGPDEDTMQVLTQPSVVVDRSVPPDDGLPPPAPTGLMPADGSVTALDVVKLAVTPIAHATRYEFALESFTRGAWQTYFTWPGPNAFRVVSPAWDDTTYRFRARATNAHGAGPWSPWAVFDFGASSSSPPPAEPPPATDPPPASNPPPSSPPPASNPPPSSSEPPVDGAPTGLAPSGGTISGDSVTLSCADVAGAVRYEFSLETVAAGTARPYYTYDKTAPQVTFWPQVHGVTYRFQVRADAGAGFGPWSAPSSFDVP